MNTLLESVRAAAVAAAAAGALKPLGTASHIVRDASTGMDFVVSVRDAAAEAGRKSSGNVVKSGAPPAAKKPFNPFEVPEAALVVDSDYTNAHLVMLNKFPVVPLHALVVTKAFECQTDMPGADDFDALYAATADLDGLAFYNCGGHSGASQRHKHFQILPRESLADGKVPLEALLGDLLGEGAAPLEPATVPAWRGRLAHSVAAVPEAPTGSDLEMCYDGLLAAAGLAASRDGVDHTGDLDWAGSHNLLLTKRWMLVVPRTRGGGPSGIGANAVGFAGFLLVDSLDDLEKLGSLGPTDVLATLGAESSDHRE